MTYWSIAFVTTGRLGRATVVCNADCLSGAIQYARSLLHTRGATLLALVSARRL